jgi:hypothetical protein
MEQTLPEFITFTGSDATTDIQQMLALSNDYPNRVEWGILLSSESGRLRYPSLSWILHFVNAFKNSNYLRSSLHVCGVYARSIMKELPKDENSEYEACINSILEKGCFERIQINHRQPSIFHSVSFARANSVRPILQHKATWFPPYDREFIDWIHDESGGNGLMPQQRPPHFGPGLLGYAGGINEMNVREVCFDDDSEYHREMMHGKRYWIDMETGVRDSQNVFSIDKCRKILQLIYGAPMRKET